MIQSECYSLVWKSEREHAFEINRNGQKFATIEFQNGSRPDWSWAVRAFRALIFLDQIRENAEGSDTSMKVQLVEAGFGEGGVI